MLLSVTKLTRVIINSPNSHPHWGLFYQSQSVRICSCDQRWIARLFNFKLANPPPVRLGRWLSRPWSFRSLVQGSCWSQVSPINHLSTSACSEGYLSAWLESPMTLDLRHQHSDKKGQQRNADARRPIRYVDETWPLRDMAAWGHIAQGWMASSSLCEGLEYTENCLTSPQWKVLGRKINLALWPEPLTRAQGMIACHRHSIHLILRKIINWKIASTRTAFIIHAVLISAGKAMTGQKAGLPSKAGLTSEDAQCTTGETSCKHVYL